MRSFSLYMSWGQMGTNELLSPLHLVPVPVFNFFSVNPPSPRPHALPPQRRSTCYSRIVRNLEMFVSLEFCGQTRDRRWLSDNTGVWNRGVPLCVGVVLKCHVCLSRKC